VSRARARVSRTVETHCDARGVLLDRPVCAPVHHRAQKGAATRLVDAQLARCPGSILWTVVCDERHLGARLVRARQANCLKIRSIIQYLYAANFPLLMLRAVACRAPKRARASSSIPLYTSRATTPTTPPTAAAVYFLHGLLGSGTNFRTLALSTSVSRPTVCVDLRNHGRSPHAASGSLDDLAGDVSALLAADARAGAPRPTLVGHSLGGKVAMRVAQTRPELLADVVVVDIAPVAYAAANNAGWLSVQRVVLAAAALDPTPFRTRADVEAALARAVPEPGVRSFVAQNLVPRAGGGYAWRCNFPALVDALPHYAAWAFAPTPPALAAATAALDAHFIAGALSSYIRPEHAPAIAAIFPRAETHVVAGAGHWVHAEKPAEFGALLSRLLKIS
jgi:pimeloyl-ACP methyl ester carboxylesterase